MSAKAYVVHHAPGRIRLRVPERRHDVIFFADVQARLGKCPNVSSAEVNPLTSGILVHHTGELYAVIGQALAAGLGDLVEIEMSAPPVPRVADRLRDQAAKVNEAVKRYTAGETDARSLAIIGLLGASLLQILRGEMLGPAIPLLWVASQITAAVPGAATPVSRRARPARHRGQTASSDERGDQR